MNIAVYTNMSDKRVIQKKITPIKQNISCHLKENTSRKNPIFVTRGRTIDVLDSSISSINYLKCSDFGRYYYVTDIVLLTGGLLEFHCTCDVLMSFASQILASNVVIDRQEFKRTPYLVDDRIPITSQRNIYSRNFTVGTGQGFNDFTGKCIAITTTGGVSNV